MPLVNLQTNLKSLRYGYDRLGAGSTDGSNQPYIKSSIPSGSGPGLGDVDFLLRGGSLLPRAVGRDVSRLTQMFFDLKSPNGLLFTAKQNVLSRSAVNILATAGGTNGDAKNRLPLNDGVYLPTSTLAQAAVNPIGGHLLKQGINPTFDTSEAAARGNVGGLFSSITGNSLPLSNPIYFETTAFEERINNFPQSRLVKFLDRNINSQTNGNELYSYSGGPDSTLGVGKTRVNALADQRTGLNNKQLINSGFFSTGISPNTNFGFDYGVFKGGTLNPNFETFRGGTYFGNIYNSGSKTVTGKYSTQTNTPLQNLLGTKNLTFKTTNDNLNGSQISLVGQSVFQSSSFESNTSVTGLQSSLTYSQLMTAKGSGSVAVGSSDNNYPQTQILEDFRQKTDVKSVTSPDYALSTNRYEGRVHLGNAGGKNLLPNGDVSTSYVSGRGEPLDKINALQIYKSENVDTSKPINDLCKFRIGVIDNDNPSLKTYIHFRAFLDSMDDSYTANWSSQTFAGRAENLYNYQGFDRKFNLGWTVVAQSKQELMPMYQKLNYLASVCAPDYSTDGYMRGNLIELTIGGYLFNQVGIMQGINYTIPMESPWEIAINATSNVGFSKSDQSVKELPFMIQVSGFSFIPIHNFVPNVQKNVFTETNQSGEGTVGDLDVFGPEKYIALSNGFFGDGYANEQALKEKEEKSQEVQQSLDQISGVSFI